MLDEISSNPLAHCAAFDHTDDLALAQIVVSDIESRGYTTDDGETWTLGDEHLTASQMGDVIRALFWAVRFELFQIPTPIDTIATSVERESRSVAFYEARSMAAQAADHRTQIEVLRAAIGEEIEAGGDPLAGVRAGFATATERLDSDDNAIVIARWVGTMLRPASPATGS